MTKTESYHSHLRLIMTIPFDNIDDEQKIVQWCSEHFGDDHGFNRRWSWITFYDNGYIIRIWLSNIEDLTLLQLAWG